MPVIIPKIVPEYDLDGLIEGMILGVFIKLPNIYEKISVENIVIKKNISNNTSNNTSNSDAAGSAVLGQYGTLTLEADGSYVYNTSSVAATDALTGEWWITTISEPCLASTPEEWRSYKYRK